MSKKDTYFIFKIYFCITYFLSINLNLHFQFKKNTEEALFCQYLHSYNYFLSYSLSIPNHKLQSRYFEGTHPLLFPNVPSHHPESLFWIIVILSPFLKLNFLGSSSLEKSN